MVEFFSGFSRHVEKRSENYGGNVGKPTEEMNNGIKVYTLRENQAEIFNDHRDCLRLLITMPPGSGKSTAVVACMRWKIENDPDHKIIIVVPQTQISKTFKQAIIRYPDSNELVWAIDNDLCNSTVTQKVSQIVKFLSNKKSNQNPHSRVLITTHMALAHAHTKIKDFSVYENVTIAIDESHHIMYDEKTNNKIGQLVKDINGNDKCSLWFVTATPYRGDQASIIPEEQLKKFEKYTLPLDEHWDKNINYISGFEFNFVIYKENEVFEGVEEVLKLGKRKTIIFCPYVGELVKDSDKNKFKRTLIDHIKKIWPDANIMDLIDTHNRVEKKKILNNDADAKEIDIILTLKIFDEGSDWVPAEQCIDLAPINSLTKQYQRFGRPWRDHFDKNIVSYYSFIPEIEDYDKEELRDHLTQSYNTFVGSLILQESITPVPFPKNKNKNNIKNPFEESVPNENNRRQILEEVTKNLLFLRNLNENPDSNEVKKSIHEALDKYEIPDENEEVSTHIVKMLRSNKDNKKIKQKKPKWVNKSIDLSWMKDAGFDHIWDNEIFDHLLSFGTSVCGVKHFSQFRRVYSDCKTVIEHRQDALRLAEENGGILPEYLTTKHTKLYVCMRKYPSYFDDIVKYSETKPTHYEWYLILKDIQNRNNGIIPLGVLKNELGKMFVIFIPIKKELLKKYKDINVIDQMTIDEIAEYFKNNIRNLQKTHKKLLDSKFIKQELGESFYNKYSSYRDKYPDKFKDFNINKLNINLVISELERVQNKYGFVPYGLRQKEFGLPLAKKIFSIVKTYPEKVKHIKIETSEIYYNKRKSDIIEQLIKLKDQFEKITSGLIRNHLNTADYYYYYRNLRKNISDEIDGFQIIDKPCDNSKIKELKKLNKKYGYIPNQKWLGDNNIGHLCHFIRTKPHLLKGMKQKVLHKTGKLQGEFSHFKTLGEEEENATQS